MGIPRNKPQNFTSLSNTTPWKESLSKNSYFHDPKGLKKNQCSKFSHWVMILSKLLDYLVPQFFHLSSQDDLIPVWHTLEKVLDEIKYVQSLPFSSSERVSANLVCRLTGIPLDQLRFPVSLDILFWCLVCFSCLKYLTFYTHCFLKIAISVCSPKPVTF